MVSLSHGERLLAYLVVSNHMVSEVLLVERNQQQLLIYYISHVLAKAEQWYPLIKKVAYALLIAS